MNVSAISELIVKSCLSREVETLFQVNLMEYLYSSKCRLANI